MNKQIRNTLFQKGEFYIVQTQLNNDHFLRVSLMNPQTSINDLKDLINEIRDIGKSILEKMNSKIDLTN